MFCNNLDNVTSCRVMQFNAAMKTLQRFSFHKPFQYKLSSTSMQSCAHTPTKFSPLRYPETTLNIKTETK